jgi:hypothetical protein
MNNTKGIIYIATEDSLVKEAEKSAATVSKHMSDTPIALITDKKRESDFFDRVLTVDNPKKSFKDKPAFIAKSPFKKTIYLDTDTKLTSDITEVFEILENFDIAAAQNARNYGLGENKRRPANSPPESLPEYNTGVLAYKKDSIRQLREKWISEFKKDEKRCNDVPPDQPSFRRAIYYSNLRIATLPRNYNCVFRRKDYINGRVKILHGRLNCLESMGAEKSIDPEYADSVLNKHEGPRVFDRKGKIIKLLSYNPWKGKYLYDLFRNHGIKTTIKESISYLKRRYQN